MERQDEPPTPKWKATWSNRLGGHACTPEVDVFAILCPLRFTTSLQMPFALHAGTQWLSLKSAASDDVTGLFTATVGVVCQATLMFPPKIKLPATTATCTIVWARSQHPWSWILCHVASDMTAVSPRIAFTGL